MDGLLTAIKGPVSVSHSVDPSPEPLTDSVSSQQQTSRTREGKASQVGAQAAGIIHALGIAKPQPQWDIALYTEDPFTTLLLQCQAGPSTVAHPTLRHHTLKHPGQPVSTRDRHEEASGVIWSRTNNIRKGVMKCLI
jgi:hypothetical protein